MMRAVLSAACEFAGLSAIIFGFFLIAPWLGWIVGGLAMVVVGLAIDPPKRSDK